MTPEERSREFCKGAFEPFGPSSLEPYIKIVAELIDGAVLDERERCAKIAENFHRWSGSAQLANAFDKAGIAAAIRKPPAPLKGK